MVSEVNKDPWECLEFLALRATLDVLVSGDEQENVERTVKLVNLVTAVQLANQGCLDPRALLEKMAKREITAKMELRVGQGHVDLEVQMEIQARLVGLGYVGYLEKEDCQEGRGL